MTSTQARIAAVGGPTGIHHRGMVLHVANRYYEVGAVIKAIAVGGGVAVALGGGEESN